MLLLYIIQAERDERKNQTNHIQILDYICPFALYLLGLVSISLWMNQNCQLAFVCGGERESKGFIIVVNGDNKGRCYFFKCSLFPQETLP